MIRARRGASALELVLVVVCVIAVGAAAFVALKDGEPPPQQNSKAVTAAFHAGLDQFGPGYLESVESSALVDTQRAFDSWARRTAKRIADLKQLKEDPSASPEAVAGSLSDRLPSEVKFAAPRGQLQYVRALVYIEFVLNGVRPVKEPDGVKEKNDVVTKAPYLAPLIEVVGTNITDLYNKYDLPTGGSYGLVSEKWSPAAGDPPDLEFTYGRISSYLAGIDRSLAELASYRTDPATGKKRGDMFSEAKSEQKNSYRRALLELVEYVVAKTKPADADKLAKSLQELRAQHDKVQAAFVGYCKDKAPNALKVQGNALRTPVNIDNDIALAEVELQAAQFLSKCAAELQATLAATSARKYSEAMKAILVGRIALDPEGKETRVGGLSTILGGAPGDEVPAALDRVLPYKKKYLRSTSDAAGNLDKLLKDLVGDGAVPSLITLSTIASRHALDRDVALVPLRERLVAELAAIEPALEAVKSTAAKYRRDAIPTLPADQHGVTLTVNGAPVPLAGGTQLAIDRIKATIETGELNADGKPAAGKDGQPLPGLAAQLAKAEEEAAGQKARLKALYERAAALAKVEIEEGADITAGAARLAAASEAIKAAMREKGAKPEFDALLGPIRRPEERGEFDKFFESGRKYQRTIGRTFPAWWEQLFRATEIEARREAGEEIADDKDPLPTELALDGNPQQLLMSAIRRDPGAVDKELGEADAAKLGKIAALDKDVRNQTLGFATGTTLVIVLGKMDEPSRKKVEEELDLAGIEKLIAVAEGDLIFTEARVPGPAGFVATVGADGRPPAKEALVTALGEATSKRQAALDSALHSRAEVVKVKLAAAKAAVEKWETTLGTQKTTAEAGRKPVEEASEVLNQVLAKALATSKELLIKEAAVARLYDESILRFHAGSVLAAQKSQRNWFQSTASLQKGTACLQAAVFYLQQHRRIVVTAETVDRVLSSTLPPGVPAPLSGATAEADTAKKHLEALKAIVAWKPTPTQGGDSETVDLSALGGGTPADDNKQAPPALRLFGHGNPEAEGSASLLVEAVLALSDARSKWKSEPKQTWAPGTQIAPDSKAVPADHFRVQETYADHTRWPFDLALGTALALTHRTLADKSLGVWEGAQLAEVTVLNVVQDKIGGAAKLDDLAAAYLIAGTVGSLATAPDYRPKEFRGLLLTQADATTAAAASAGPALSELLRRVGVESLRRFNEAVNKPGT